MNTQILAYFYLSASQQSAVPLLLLCARAAIPLWSVCVYVTVYVSKISFEELIWSKVALDADRAVILFPNVREQHL